MDRLSFQITEQIDHLMHTVSPYFQYGSQLAANAVEFTFNQLSTTFTQFGDIRTSSGITLQNWAQWHWTWFLDQLHALHFYLHRCMASHFREINVLLHQGLIFFERKIDHTHFYFCICGVIIGFAIGVSCKPITKVQPKMRALVCSSYSGPESIIMSEDVFVPQSCGSYEVIVQVKASSIDYLDLKISQGYGKVFRRQHHRYNSKANGKSIFPFTLGRECSGRIVETGSKVQDLEVGDEVYAAVPYYACGTASELALIPAEWVARKPKKISHEAAASLPYSSAVVWNALVHQASFNQNTTAGKRVLIHSVNNPMGCVAVQLIKAWGGHVTATVSSVKLPIAQQLGVDDIIVYDGKEDDYRALLTTRPKFHLVVNTLGSFLHDFCKAVCQQGGIVVSTVASPPAADQYGIVFGALYSFWLRIRLRFQKESIIYGDTTVTRELLDEISSLVDQGHLQPIIDKVFDITQAEQARQWVVTGNPVGKVVIRFR